MLPSGASLLAAAMAIAAAVVLVLAVKAVRLWRRSKVMVAQRHAGSAADAKFAHPCLALSAVELAAALRARTWTAVEVLDAYTTQLDCVNRRLNAVCARRYAAARAEAEVADACLDAADGSKWALNAGGGTALPPFLGVPITVKECFEMAGMPHTAGHPGRRGRVGTRDAPAVQRLRAAGCVVMASTNLSQLCMWYESHNKVYGRTCNPYNPHRIAGGSSGGEGAVAGAAGSAAGLGSDVGGSLRMPAFFNGVYSHKASSGVVPNTGQHPCSFTAEASGILATGPLCRHSIDLWPLMRVMAGSDGKDLACAPTAPQLRCGSPQCDGDGAASGWKCGACFRPSASPPAALRALLPSLQSVAVYMVDDLQGCRPMLSSRLHPDLLASTRRVADAIVSGCGVPAAVTSIPLPELRSAGAIWSSMLADAGPPAFRDLMQQDGQALALPWELLKALAGLGAHTVPAVALAMIEHLPQAWAPAAHTKAVADGRAMQARLTELLGANGVLVVPTHATPAPCHKVPMLPTRILNFAWTSIWNAMGFPATAVPTGLSKDLQLPVGVQLVGAPGSDALTMALARVVEAEVGGWVPPNLAVAPHHHTTST